MSRRDPFNACDPFNAFNASASHQGNPSQGMAQEVTEGQNAEQSTSRYGVPPPVSAVVLREDKMKICIAISVALLLATPCFAGMNKAKPTGKPDRVLKKGEWEFQIFYRAKGSRSEGQHGILIHKGEIIPPGKKDEEKKPPFGVMIYYGDEYQSPWQTTGWNFKDKTKILSSWKKKHPAEQSPGGDVQKAAPQE